MAKQIPARAWIKARLTELGLEVQDLAAALRIEQPMASKIITGRRAVQGAELTPLAKVLAMPKTEVEAKLYGAITQDAPTTTADQLAFRAVERLAAIQPLTADQRYALVQEIAADLRDGIPGLR